MGSALRRAAGAAWFLALCASSGAPADDPAPAPAIPAWIQDAIVYEILPDRFANADPRNDPRPQDLRGAFPYDVPRGFLTSPWTADWFEMQPWEKSTGRDFYTVAAGRRYGGDLQGILDRLDYVQGLGVNTIVLNPVFEAPSAEGYDPSFFHHVDNNLGPDPEGDRLVLATENPALPATWKWTAADRLFLRLVQECRRRRLRVIVDAPLGHAGPMFWAYRDLRAKGRTSRYADWFEVRTFDDPKTPTDETDAATAEGNRDWPAFRRVDGNLAPGPREHLRLAVKRWLDPNGDGDPTDGVDGLRLVGAPGLPPAFVEEVGRWARTANAEALVTGEGKAPWAAGVRAFFVDQTAPLSAADLDSLLSALATDKDVRGAFSAIDGRRTARLASQVVNPDRGADAAQSPREDPRYEVRAPTAEEWRRLRLVAAFEFAAPTLPVVVYGTEAGLWGGASPDRSKPMLWKETPHAPEAAHPLGQPRKKDPVRFDPELHRYYQALAKARSDQVALRRGSFEVVLADDARRLFAFARVHENERVIAVFNAGVKEASVEVPAPAPAVREILSGRRLKAANDKVSLTVPAQSAAYLAADTK